MSTERSRAAFIRAISALTRTAQAADRLRIEIGDATPVHGIPIVELDENDSLVTVVAGALEATKANGSGS